MYLEKEKIVLKNFRKERELFKQKNSLQDSRKQLQRAQKSLESLSTLSSTTSPKAQPKDTLLELTSLTKDLLTNTKLTTYYRRPWQNLDEDPQEYFVDEQSSPRNPSLLFPNRMGLKRANSLLSNSTNKND